MNVREVAAQYISKGWQVVPLKPKSKECYSDDWQKLIFVPDMFRDGDNIGIRSLNGLVDIDCDAPEVVACAPAFLPPTGAVYGRPSKPRSHWLYTCATVDKLVALKDKVVDDQKKATLIEIRVKHQSMAPPSIHPDGEAIAWERVFKDIGFEASEVEKALLIRSVRLTATCGLISRHYNPKGDRHDWGVALSGLLKQLGLSSEECSKIFVHAAAWARDNEVKDRLDAVRSTFNRGDDDSVKAGKALEEVMGDKGKAFVTSIRMIWGEDSQGIPRGILEKLNEKHAVVFQQSGELVVITEDTDAFGNHTLRFSNLQTIRDLYPTNIIVGWKGPAGDQPIWKKVGQAWLDDPKRRFYNGIELAPNGKCTPGYYNLWKGFSVEPKKGDWSRFKDHIRTIIADGSSDIYDYVINWMAKAVQFPGKPAETAIALRGGQGTGKSTFATWFGGLFGQHFVHLDSTRQLTGNFNAHLHNAILVFADEAAWPGDKAGVGALRRMVTEKTLQIERKGMDVMTVTNLIHMLLASNEDWIVPAALDERRFAVFDVSRSKQGDSKYFAATERQLFHEGGLAAMLYDLLEWKVEMRVPVPDTKALREQKQLTASPARKWWYQVLYDGDLWREDQRYEDGYRVERDRLYELYVEGMERGSFGRQAVGLKVELGRFLRKVLPDGYPKTVRQGTAGTRFWILPSLSECRRFYEKEHRIRATDAWPEEAGFGSREPEDLSF